MRDLDPNLTHGSLGPSEPTNPNGISIGSAIFAGLTSVTGRSRDHTIRSVTICRIYVRSSAMQPNNIAKSDLSNKTIRHEVINLFCGRHATDDTTGVMQNATHIVFSVVVTRLYLQT